LLIARYDSHADRTALSSGLHSDTDGGLGVCSLLLCSVVEGVKGDGDVLDTYDSVVCDILLEVLYMVLLRELRIMIVRYPHQTRCSKEGHERSCKDGLEQLERTGLNLHRHISARQRGERD
jgi:hypothetical protein